MITYSSIFSATVSGLVIVAWLPSPIVLAAPIQPSIKFTPPLVTAKTIQVTEVVFEAQDGVNPGPLKQTGTTTFLVKRPDKFRVEWKDSDPSKPVFYSVSDGNTIVTYDGKQFHSQSTASAEWPYPLMGLLNNMPGSVSCESTIREGKKVLLAVSGSFSSRNEYWFDPKTHLLIRWMMFITWKGKTSEMMRTDFSDWALDKPLPTSVFQIPPVTIK